MENPFIGSGVVLCR